MRCDAADRLMFWCVRRGAMRSSVSEVITVYASARTASHNRRVIWRFHQCLIVRAKMRYAPAARLF